MQPPNGLRADSLSSSSSNSAAEIVIFDRDLAAILTLERASLVVRARGACYHSAEQLLAGTAFVDGGSLWAAFVEVGELQVVDAGRA